MPARRTAPGSARLCPAPASAEFPGARPAQLRPAPSRHWTRPDAPPRRRAFPRDNPYPAPRRLGGPAEVSGDTPPRGHARAPSNPAPSTLSPLLPSSLAASVPPHSRPRPGPAPPTSKPGHAPHAGPAHARLPSRGLPRPAGPAVPRRQVAPSPSLLPPSVCVPPSRALWPRCRAACFTVSRAVEEGAASEVLPLAAPGRGTGRWRPRAGPLAEPRAGHGDGGGQSVRGWGRGRP